MALRFYLFLKIRFNLFTLIQSSISKENEIPQNSLNRILKLIHKIQLVLDCERGFSFFYIKSMKPLNFKLRHNMILKIS